MGSCTGLTSNSSIGGDDDPSQLKGFDAFEVVFSRGTGTWLEENTPTPGKHSGGEEIIVDNDDIFFEATRDGTIHQDS